MLGHGLLHLVFAVVVVGLVQPQLVGALAVVSRGQPAGVATPVVQDVLAGTLAARAAMFAVPAGKVRKKD